MAFSFNMATLANFYLMVYAGSSRVMIFNVGASSGHHSKLERRRGKMHPKNKVNNNNIIIIYINMKYDK